MNKKAKDKAPYRGPQTLEELRDEPGFDPNDWNWCVDRNSVPDGTDGFTDRVEIYVIETGAEQCQHAITMSGGHHPRRSRGEDQTGVR